MQSELRLLITISAAGLLCRQAIQFLRCLAFQKCSYNRVRQPLIFLNLRLASSANYQNNLFEILLSDCWLVSFLQQRAEQSFLEKPLSIHLSQGITLYWTYFGQPVGLTRSSAPICQYFSCFPVHPRIPAQADAFHEVNIFSITRFK